MSSQVKKTTINRNAFEEVSLKTFVGNTSSEIHSIIAKVAGNNATVISGIEALMNDTLVFHSFDRALPLLLNAKNEQHLQRVEAVLQFTANEIYNKGPIYISHKQASLYLYTIQNLILNLGQWKFPKKKINTYKPSLILKLQFVKTKCKCLNIGDDIIRSQCMTDEFQQAYDENLRKFEYLDEQALNDFTRRVNIYEKSRNMNDLTVPRSPKFNTVKQKTNTGLEKIIFFIESTFNLKELTLHFYTRYFHYINDEVAKFIGSNDLYQIYTIADMIKEHLGKKEQFNEIIK